MVTPVSDLNGRPATTLYTESFGEAGLTFATICGAMLGAVAGASFGEEFSSSLQFISGTLGTTLGGGLAAGVWCLWEKVRASKATRKHIQYDETAELTHAG